MTILKKVSIIIILLFIIPSLSFANQWAVDQGHASVSFKVKHVYSLVAGHFTDFKGDFVFNPENLSNSYFNFAIKVKSIQTFNGKRDTHLKSKDFFNADKYPEMAFQSSKVKFKGENTYTLEGEMTIKDVTKKVSLDFTFHGPKEAPFDKKKLVAGFDTSFEIDRLEYNVGSGKFFKMGVVGRFVQVDLSLEALTKK